MRSWARLPYRCRVCRKRFYHLDSALAEQRAEELDRMGDPETVQDNGPVAAPPCRRRSYRVVIRIRLPRLLRPRPAG